MEFPATDAELPAETSLPKPVVKPMKQSRNKPEFNGCSVADSAVLSQGLKGRYKRPLTSRDFIGL